MATVSTQSLLALGVVVLLFCTSRLRIYLRLRKIPGPALAALTDFWMFAKLWNGETWRDMSVHLHETYGSVVRYGPKRVMFNKASAIPTIFSTSNLLEKVCISFC
jgi:hypothetical protein